VSTQFEPSLPVGAYLVRLRASFDPGLFASATSPALKAAVRLELGQLFAGAGFKLTEVGVPATAAGRA
jgi:ribonuclease P protein component